LHEKFLGLDHDMQMRLKDLLDGQIKGLLTRIEEELPSLTSDDDIQSRKRLAQQQQRAAALH
jgi:hypothetical protein